MLVEGLHFFFHSMNVSFTYLIQSFGHSTTVSKALFSNTSMNRFAATGDSGEPMAAGRNTLDLLKECAFKHEVSGLQAQFCQCTDVRLCNGGVFFKFIILD